MKKTGNINIRLDEDTIMEFDKAIEWSKDDPKQLITKSSVLRGCILKFIDRTKKKYSK